jgi:hypothetical protein
MARVTQAMAMARKMAIASEYDYNHDDGNNSDNDDHHKGQTLSIAKMCCQTHKSKNYLAPLADALAIS